MIHVIDRSKKPIRIMVESGDKKSIVTVDFEAPGGKVHPTVRHQHPLSDEQRDLIAEWIRREWDDNVEVCSPAYVRVSTL